MFFALLFSPGCGWKRCTKLPENYQKKDWSAKVVFFQWPPVCVLIIFFISCCLVTVMTLKAELCRLVYLVQQQNYDKILTLISHQFSSAVFFKKNLTKSEDCVRFLFFRWSLSSWCVLLLLSVGERTAAGEARMLVWLIFWSYWEFLL